MTSCIHTLKCRLAYRVSKCTHMLWVASQHRYHHIAKPLTKMTVRRSPIQPQLFRSYSTSSSAATATASRSNTSSNLHPALQGHRYSLLFLGAPGVGKGTFGKVIAPYFDAQMMTSSDLLRDAADEQLKNGDSEAKATGEYIKECIKTGKLVRDELVIPIVCEFLQNCSGSFIFDGFPRTINQAQQLQEKYPLDLGIYFKLPHHLLVNKMLGRRVCVNHRCNSSYNVTEINEGEIVMPSMKPKKDGICDHCGSELEIRIDDTMEVIEERLRIFYEQNIPIVEYYKACGLLVEWDVKRGVDDIPDIMHKIEKKLLANGKGKKQVTMEERNNNNHHSHP